MKGNTGKRRSESGGVLEHGITSECFPEYAEAARGKIDKNRGSKIGLRDQENGLNLMVQRYITIQLRIWIRNCIQSALL